MSRLELIPDFDENIERCKTCMLTKIFKSYFPNVKRITKLLELIIVIWVIFIALHLLEERNTMSLLLMILQHIVQYIFYMLKVKYQKNLVSLRMNPSCIMKPLLKD